MWLVNASRIQGDVDVGPQTFFLLNLSACWCLPQFIIADTRNNRGTIDYQVGMDIKDSIGSFDFFVVPVKMEFTTIHL
jgi:hypothetical protein